MHLFGKKIKTFTNDYSGNWYTLTNETILSLYRPIRPLLIKNTQVLNFK